MKLIKDFPNVKCHRLIWLNSEARENWEGALQQISQEMQLLEIRSVLEGQRMCGTITIKPEMLAQYQRDYPDLVFTVLRNTAPFEGFSHKHQEPESGKPFLLHCVYSLSHESNMKFKGCFDTGNHDSQGFLLGFPACCTAFFTNVWMDGYFDPVYQAAENTHRMTPAEEGNTIIVIDVHPYSNPLLRYLGIRVCFHIPHAFNCKETIAAAMERVKLMDRDLKPIMEALLSMPMMWDVNHGIAQIKTPIFWLLTGSLPTAENYKVIVRGEFIPKEGKNVNYVT